MITIRATVLPILLLACVLPSATGAAMAEKPAWLGTGDKIPAVTLRNAMGEQVDLLAEVRKQPTVLIFYRGGWCPYCNRHLAALAGIEADLKAAGYGLIAISPDRPARLYDAPKREKQPDYLLLSDQDAKAIDAFGVSFVVPTDLVAKYKESHGIDLEADSGRTHHKLPHPGVFIADTQGVIRFAHVDTDYKVRLDPDQILAAAKQAMMAKP